MGSQSASSNTSRTVYGNTTTTNPYAYSKTTNKGTISGFQDNTALKSVYDIVNKSIDSLLNEYLNPSLNSSVNKAKLNSFVNTLNTQTRNNLENNIINPLSARNMLRSSQANDLYRNLSNQNAASISNYANDLISNSQTETAKMLTNLLSYYLQGANYLMNMQNHSLKASSGNATRYNTSDSGSQNISNQMVQDVLSNAILAMASTL